MDTSQLIGTWQPIRAELDGENAPDMALQSMKLVLGPGTYRVEFGGKTSDEGDWVLASAETDFAVFSLLGRHGPNVGREIPAIIQLRGNRLRVCYGLDGKTPLAFETAPGAKRYLVTYRRVE